MKTIVQNEVVARLPKKSRGGLTVQGDCYTKQVIERVPPNVVFGELHVLKKPEPIQKRKAKR